MGQPRWRIEDLPWGRFDRSKVDGDLLAVVKAAALVEYNADDYTAYLCNVFRDDPDFCEAARGWAVEEVQHGVALGRWAELADPGFSLEKAVVRFRALFRVPIDVERSVRGSQSGELIARCMVETATSSFYTALAGRSDEPVLAVIARTIAADELRHYKLFLTHSKRYLERERIGRWQRVRVAMSRIGESEDDELATAYYAANVAEDEPYQHARCCRAYMRQAYGLYRRPDIARGVAMIFKACGLKPHTRLCDLVTGAVWWIVRIRARRLARSMNEPVAV
jgi:rubrerythrin